MLEDKMIHTLYTPDLLLDKLNEVTMKQLQHVRLSLLAYIQILPMKLLKFLLQLKQVG